MERKKWLVFYTKSKQEKVVNSVLQKFGFHSYLPLYKVMRQWSDRKKKVEVPLFNSYIFVFDHEWEIGNILKTPGIIKNIRYNDKPACLRESELETIKRFIASGLTIDVQSIDDIAIGDKVKVMDGLLKGAEGILSGDYNESKFYIMLESINQALTVSIDKGLLKKL